MTITSANTEPERFVRLPAVREITGKSTSSIYRDMQGGLFPRPVALGPNARAWRLAEITAWQTQRIAARDTGEDAPLRAMNPNIGKGRPRGGRVGTDASPRPVTNPKVRKRHARAQRVA
jgi:prophage regulatory protein